MTEHHLEVLTTDDPGRWKEVLGRIGVYDFHHLRDYHRLAEMRGEGEGRLLVYRDGSHIIAFPALIRRIEESPFDGAGDATSAHGYLGPLATPQLPEGVRRGFLHALHAYYESRGIVTAFSRLHPLIDQTRVLQGYGEIAEVGVTVSIDLTLPPDEQVAGYRKSNRYEIQRLSKMGFTCGEEGAECLDDFIRI